MQVQQASGTWDDVTLPAGHVIMLPGYTLERATCGLVKATRHRVVRTNLCPAVYSKSIYLCVLT